MIRVPASLIAVGRRFKFDVFDASGQIMLMRGSPVETERQARRIRSEGFRRQPAQRAVSPFCALSAIADRLSAMEDDLLARRSEGLWHKRIGHLVQDFIDVSDAEPDAAFANIHLEVHHSYFVVHSLMVALVAARLALAKGVSSADRFSIIGAALTHDFGIVTIREELESAGELSEWQRMLVRQHTGDSVILLGRFGIDDPLWLTAVGDHHEYLDGSGYAGKRGDQISVAARILAVADAYSAMLRPRPYRERIVASKVLEILYAEEHERYDRQILEALFWDFGFYPPGSLVRLASREMAVAVRNTPGLLDSPLVAVICDRAGRPLMKPVLRDTQQAESAIVDTLDPALAVRVGRAIENCWAIPGRIASN